MIWGGALKACWYRENAKFDTWRLSMWRTPREAHPVRSWEQVVGGGQGHPVASAWRTRDLLGQNVDRSRDVMLCSWNERLTCFLHHWRSKSSEQCLGCRHFWIPQTCSCYSAQKYLVNGLWANKCTEHRRVKSTQWEEGRGQKNRETGWAARWEQDVENRPRDSNVFQREAVTRTLNGPLGLTTEHQIMCLLQGSLGRIPGIWECSLWWVGSQSVWGKCLNPQFRNTPGSLGLV